MLLRNNRELRLSLQDSDQYGRIEKGLFGKRLLSSLEAKVECAQLSKEVGKRTTGVESV